MFARNPRTAGASAVLLVLCWPTWMAEGLIPPTPVSTKVTPGRIALLHPGVASSSRHGTRLYEELKEQEKGFFQSIFDPYPTKIPPEMKEEINRAEENTAAAKERQKRISLYIALAVVLVLCACFNAFLTELRDTIDPSTVSRYNELVPQSEQITKKISLQDFGFGWVDSNFLFQFLFISRIGGAISLVSGAIFGILVEAELDAKRANAEKIWEEIVRRRGGSGQFQQKPVDKPERQKSKKRSKKGKRLDALSEVVLEESIQPPSTDDVATEIVEKEEAQVEAEKEDGGIFGKLKEFYDKADNMAASQALLLNKELEDKGVVEKITDETGLKVIGREEAAKLVEEGGDKPKKEKSDDGK